MWRQYSICNNPFLCPKRLNYIGLFTVFLTEASVSFLFFFLGYARISNVEFYHSGQEGWTDFYDPRYSLAFLDTGTVDDAYPSFVKGCSFHNGFSSAIGLYGAHGVMVQDNVIHHTVGPGKSQPEGPPHEALRHGIGV